MEPTATPQVLAWFGERESTIVRSAGAWRRRLGPQGTNAVFLRWYGGCQRYRKPPGNGPASTGAHGRAPRSEEKISIRRYKVPAREGVEGSGVAAQVFARVTDRRNPDDSLVTTFVTCAGAGLIGHASGRWNARTVVEPMVRIYGQHQVRFRVSHRRDRRQASQAADTDVPAGNLRRHQVNGGTSVRVFVEVGVR